MKVLLIKNIAKLGVAGEIKEVSDGYARNFLFGQGLATLVSQENIAKWQHQSDKKGREQHLSQEKIDRLKHRLLGMVLKLTKATNDKGHLFAKIRPVDINILLNEQNITIKDKDILLPVIKEIGKYQIEIKITDAEKLKVALDILPAKKSK